MTQLFQNQSDGVFSPAHIKILLVDSIPEDVERIEQALAEVNKELFEITAVTSLESAKDVLSQSAIDIILLDLFLTDTRGLDTFLKIRGLAEFIPIVVLSSFDDDRLAVEVVGRGAQDYLLKREVEGKFLARIIRYSIERERLQRAVRDLSLVDELTGVYNRRGFMTLAEQQLRLAQRRKSGFLLLLVDLDQLKKINDTHGHSEGDQVIHKAADILKAAFRRSDVVARIGGDEFAVVAIDAARESEKILTGRVSEKVKEYNQLKPRPYEFSLSMGVAYLNGEDSSSLEDLLKDADKGLYEAKKSRHTVSH